MINFYFKVNDTRIKCINCNIIVGCEFRNKDLSKVFTSFVKDVLFQNVGIYFILESKQQVKFYFEDECHSWIQNGPWYNTTFFSHFLGSSFEYFFTTTLQYIYDLTCSYKAYDNLH